MSAQAEVAPPSSGSDGPGSPLRVRPPSPLSRSRRIAIAAVAGVAVLIGAVLVVQARTDDGDTIPGAAWRGLPVPRAADVDDFGFDGPLGQVPDFGRWVVDGPGLERSGGLLRSGDGATVATVDAGSRDVLVHAQVVSMTTGSGLLISSASTGVPGLALRVTGPGRWALLWERSGPPPQVLQSFEAPTEDVSVQVTRRGTEARVAFDDRVVTVEVPPETGGTAVGIASEGPGNQLDLFGYLPLAAG